MGRPKLLILGGSGFIGTHLVSALVAGRAENEIAVYSRNKNPVPVPGAQYIVGSIANLRSLERALHECGVVFHLVSSTIPATAERNRGFDVSSNVIGTIRLLELCVKKGVRKVVFLSSGGTIYGVPKEIPISETHPTEPICSHGIAKLAIEKYIALFHKLYDLDYLILRLSNVYGEYQNPFGTFGFINSTLGRVLMGRPIAIWGDGTTTRDYLHVGDAVEAIVQLTWLQTSEKIFNIATGQGSSLLDVVEIVRRVTRRNVEVQFEPGRSIDVPRNVLCIQRARQAGWAPRISLEDGARRSWEWIRSTYMRRICDDTAPSDHAFSQQDSPWRC